MTDMQEHSQRKVVPEEAGEVGGVPVVQGLWDFST